MMSYMHSFIFMLFTFSVLIIEVFNIRFRSDLPGKSKYPGHEDGNITSFMQQEKEYLSGRKLLLHGLCTNRDISISQSRSSTVGIPKYIVEIVNTCVSGCAPSNIHLHCGWFASARMVNPRFFKRLAYDDCLVNGGNPLRIGQTIRFTYSNSFMYPISFKSAKFC